VRLDACRAEGIVERCGTDGVTEVIVKEGIGITDGICAEGVAEDIGTEETTAEGVAPEELAFVKGLLFLIIGTLLGTA